MSQNGYGELVYKNHLHEQEWFLKPAKIIGMNRNGFEALKNHLNAMTYIINCATAVKKIRCEQHTARPLAPRIPIPRVEQQYLRGYSTSERVLRRKHVSQSGRTGVPPSVVHS